MSGRQPPHRYGFIVFDDTENPDTGTCAIAGGKATRIEQVSELPTDVMWWTNLPYASFRHPAIGNLSNLRYNKFLGITPEECLMEWGYHPSGIAKAEYAAFVSRLFSRVMTISFGLLSEIDPRRHPHAVFLCRDLRFDFASALPRHEYPSDEAAAVLKAGYSYVEFTGVARMPMRGVPRVMLRRPRLAHAIDIFCAPVPDGEMKFARGGGRGDLHDVLDANAPVLSEVVVSNANPAISPVFAFGHSMDRKSKVMRSWVPHPELVAMSAFAEIEIRNTWRGQKYRRLIDSMPDPVVQFLMSDFSTLSWSAGLIAENLWKSQCVRNQRPPTPGQEQADSSWIGTWIKSTDKTLSFLSVMDVEASSGIPVSSYGFGYGWFSCPSNQINDLVRSAMGLGMVPRPDCIPADFSGESARWGGDRRSAVAATLLARRQTTALLNIDRVMLAPEPDRPAIMAKIMGEIRKG